MSSLTNDAENALALLMFNNTTWAGIGDGTGVVGSTADGVYGIALFTGDPGETGSVANECDYTNYDRVEVARTNAGFTVTGATISNTAEIAFPQSGGGGTDTVTHWAICKSGTPSTSDVIIAAALNNNRDVADGATPKFAIGELTVTVS